MSKIQGDNNWLVDRLSEFGEENERLKYSMPTPVKQESPMKSTARTQVINEMKQTSQALKDFEIARTKLIENFEKAPGMLTPK